MIAARHRFPSRGSMAAATASVRVSAAMQTPPPPEAPQGMFEGGLPIPNLVRVGVRELFTSMLNAATAVRLGDNAAKPRYFGTVTPDPQVWRSPAEPNSEDSVRAGMVSAGNAPQMLNKTTAEGEPPRIAASLPQRRR